MADVETLEEISPSLSPSPSPSPEDEEISRSQKVSYPVGTGQNQKMAEAWKKIDKVALLLSAVILAQVWLIWQLVLPALQITKETCQEYRDTIKQFNDEKFKMFEERITQLELENEKNATTPAEPKE